MYFNMTLCAQTALFKQLCTAILEILSNLSNSYCMEKFLSHFSAAIIWDIPYIECVLGLKAKETGSVDITVMLSFTEQSLQSETTKF